MQIGVKCVRGLISHDECRRCALNPLHPCQYPPDVLEMMRIDYEDPDREPGVESFTPTRIIGCTRQPVLMQKGDYYVDVDQQYPATRGHMIHALMEQSRYPGVMGTVREQRLSATVQTSYGPQRFTGKPDLIVLKEVAEEGGERVLHVKVVDYKSIGEIGHDLTHAKPQHVWQVNMYAWLVTQELLHHIQWQADRVVVDELEIVYGDMKKMRRFTSAGWLQARGKRLNRTPPYQYATLDLEPIDLYPIEQTERAIRRRIEARLRATEELPPPLEGEEAWLCNYCPVRERCQQLAKEGIRVLEGTEVSRRAA